MLLAVAGIAEAMLVEDKRVQVIDTFEQLVETSGDRHAARINRPSFLRGFRPVIEQLGMTGREPDSGKPRCAIRARSRCSPSAPLDTFDEFFDRIDTWNRGGAPCP